jgi:hypothetical protein
MFPPILYVETLQRIVTRIKRASYTIRIRSCDFNASGYLGARSSGESVLTDNVLVSYIAYEAKT